MNKMPQRGRPRRSRSRGRPVLPYHSLSQPNRRDAESSRSPEPPVKEQIQDAQILLLQQSDRDFCDTLRSIAVISCPVCLMLDLKETESENVEQTCKLCAQGRNSRFSPQNICDPGDVPDELKGLSLVEEMVISLIHPQTKVYRIKGSGQLRYSGNIISFPQDVQSLAIEHFRTALKTCLLCSSAKRQCVTVCLTFVNSKSAQNAFSLPCVG